MRLRTYAILATVVLIAGCGSSSKPSSTSNAATTTSGATTSTATTPPANGKSAEQILADSIKALDSTPAFNLTGTVPAGTGKGVSTLTANVRLPGKLSITLGQGAQQLSVIAINTNAWLQANAAFWQANSPTLAATLGGKWITAPAAMLQSLGPVSALLNSGTAGYCLLGAHHGTLSVVGNTTVDGQSAVELADKGDVPGSIPGNLWVAANGSPLPIQYTVTGSQKPGGSPSAACHETAKDLNGKNTGVSVKFGYSNVAAIAPPPHPVSLSSLGGL